MTTDKPEPLTVGASLIFLGMQAAIFKATKSADLNQLGKTLEEIAALIRSLDERARAAEARASDLTAKSDGLEAKVKGQAKEIERLKKPKTCFWLDGKICCEERMHSGPDDYCHACGGKVVTGRSDD